MKAWKIFWGLGFILLAVALILNAIGVVPPLESVVGEISFIAIVGVLLLLSWVIERLVRGKIGEIFIPLAFIFMIIEKNIAYVCGLDNPDFLHNGLVFGCAALLWIGVSTLMSGIRRKKRKKFRVVHKTGRSYSTKHEEYSSAKTNESSFTSAEKYIDSSDFTEEWFENNLGALSIHFENADEYQGGGILHVENNLGATKIYVPSSWSYIHDIDNSLGGVNADIDGGNPSGPKLIIKGENNLGAIQIEYEQ